MGIGKRTILLLAFACCTVSDMMAQPFAFNHWWTMANGIIVGWNTPSNARRFISSGASEGWFGTAIYSSYKYGAAMSWLGPYDETGLIADAYGIRSISDPRSTDTSKFYVPYYWSGSRRRNAGYDSPVSYPSGMSQVALFPMPGNNRMLYFATPKSYSDSASYGGYIDRSLSVLDIDNRTVRSVDSVLQPLFDIDPALETPTELVSACADQVLGVTWLVFVNRPTSGSNNIIFYAFKIENDTIYKPVRSEVSGKTDVRGKLTLSASGGMAAVGNNIYRFHPGSGTFNVYCTLSGSSLSNSPAFSPRGRYVWVPGYKVDTTGDSSSVLYQYDVQYPGLMKIPIATLTMGQMRWYDAGGYVSHALSPDCKLYFAMESMLFALKYPDEIGVQSDSLLAGQDHFWSSLNGMPRTFDGFHGLPDLINQLTFSLDSTSCLWPKASFVVDTVCLGECVTMDSVFYAGVEKWLWTFEGGTPRTSDNKKPPCVTFNSPGLHKVTLIYSNGIAVDTIERYANVLPPPDVDVGPDLSVCFGDTVLLTATGATKYRWFPTIGLSDPDSASTRLVPTANKSIYVVRGIDSNGCEGLDTIVITRGALNATINGVRDLCRGQSVTLRASGGVRFKWLDEFGTEFSDAQNVTVRPSETATYRVVVSSGNCEDTASITLRVHDNPELLPIGDTTICRGENLSLQARVVGDSSVTVEWRNTSDNSVVIGRVLSAAPMASTSYVVRSRSIHGCEDSASFTIVVKPQVPATKVDTTVCDGQVLTIGGVSFVAHADTSFVLVRESSVTCADTIRATIVIDRPSLTVNDATGCRGQMVTLKATTNCTMVSWYGENNDLLGSGTTVDLQLDGSQRVLCVATSPAGCTVADTANIIVTRAREIFISHGSASGPVGSTLTTNMRVLADEVDMPLVINMTSTYPGLVPERISSGQVLNDGTNMLPVKILVGDTGVSTITWRTYLSSMRQHILDATPQIEIDECTRVTITKGVVTIEGCALEIRTIQMANITRVTIFDLTGRFVSELPIESLNGGQLVLHQLPPGIYIARIQWGAYVEYRNVLTY